MTEERREYTTRTVPAGANSVSAGNREFALPDADPLPERFDYRDEGCELYPLCLECPLPYCRHDPPQAGRRTRTRLRDDRLLEQRRRGNKSVAELAASFGVSRRTVQRIIRRSANE